MWSVAALSLALLMTPLFVRLCHSLSALTGRGAHRIVATNRGMTELERLRSGTAENRVYDIPELPSGRSEVTVSPMADSRLRQARVTVSWIESGRPARSEWVTLLPAAGGGR